MSFDRWVLLAVEPSGDPLTVQRSIMKQSLDAVTPRASSPRVELADLVSRCNNGNDGVVVMAGAGSAVVRRQLGSKLRQLRLAAGKDVADVVTSGLGSKAKVSRIENGKGPVKVADIRLMCWLYGADEATTQALAALAPGTQQEGWWEEYGVAVVPDWLRLYVGLEASASKIRSFEPEVVHGLLQTPAYTRAVIEADPRLSTDVVAQRLRLRLERQQAVEAQLTMIIGEAVLSFVVGSAEVMTAQVDHLRKSEAEVRVLPFAAGAYLRRGSFALLDFADPDDPAVAYVEGPGGARYFDRPEERAEYEFVWKTIFEKSIPIKEWTR